MDGGVGFWKNEREIERKIFSRYKQRRHGKIVKLWCAVSRWPFAA
jgi:hypothetical protein